MSFDLESLVDLALFERLVESRSFSEAARRTGIAKSAVSRRIALLEQRLGVQLLRRSTRSLEVTADGAQFYEHCVRMVQAARAAEDAVSGAESKVRGLVRVSAPVTFTQMYLAPVLARFLLQHPEVDLRLTTDDRFVDPLTSEFELVIRVARLRDGQFVAKRLTTDRLVLAGAPAYFAQNPAPGRAEDLVQHNCLRYSLVEGNSEWLFRDSQGGRSSFGRGNFAVNDGATLREMMLAGLGLAVLPYFMIARDVEQGRAELVLEGARNSEIGIYAVVARTRGLPLRVRRLMECLERHFGDPNWRRSAAQ